MHIVFPLMGLTKTGGLRVITQLANGFFERGHKVSILVSRPVTNEGFFICEGIHIKQSGVRMTLLGELYWLIRNVPHDAHVLIATYYLTAFAVVIAAFLLNKKGYYFIQGYEPDFFIDNSYSFSSLVKRTIAKISYRLPLHQVTISTWLQHKLRNINGRDVTVINDGVDTDVFSPNHAEKQRKNFKSIMCIGRREQIKGFRYFLKAVSVLKNDYSQLNLLIVTQDRSLVPDATKISTEIIYPVNDEELAMCYNRADVFVFPSLCEGFGLPPLEAMACGTPVVTTDCGGVMDFVEDGINCLVVPSKNPQAMSEAIFRILNNEELAEHLSVRGRETSFRFSWDIMVDKFEKLMTI